MQKDILTEVIEEGEQIANTEVSVRELRNYWKMLGPGLTTGAADDDPSGIATYSQTGAHYGTQLIWLSLFTFPLMANICEMCARIGLVTGRGLARNIRFNYPRGVLYLCAILLFVANTFNIGADLGAMAKATQLILPNIDFKVLLIGFTAATLILQIFSTYEKYAKYLKYLAMVLLSYVASALFVKLDWGAVVKDLVTPNLSFNRDQLFLICGILGTTISPYLFFWQTSQEVEEEILEGKTTLAMRRNVSKGQISKMRVDVWSGMFVSNAVMFFIIAASAGALYAANIKGVETAEQAAQALRPVAGDLAYFLFALGIIGVGLLAVPVLAGSASYAISESLGWREGLYQKLRKASGFYGIIIISTLIGLGMNFGGIDPIKALIFSAVLNGLVAPVVLIFIVHLSSSKKVMGEMVSNRFMTWVGWLTTGLMALAGIAAIFSLLF